MAVALPPEITALLDQLVVVQDGRVIGDLNEKLLMVSSEILGDDYMVRGHVIVWARSTITFEECERVLETLDSDVAAELWDAASAGALVRTL